MNTRLIDFLDLYVDYERKVEPFLWVFNRERKYLKSNGILTDNRMHSLEGQLKVSENKGSKWVVARSEEKGFTVIFRFNVSTGEVENSIEFSDGFDFTFVDNGLELRKVTVRKMEDEEIIRRNNGLMILSGTDRCEEFIYKIGLIFYVGKDGDIYVSAMLKHGYWMLMDLKEKSYIWIYNNRDK